MKSIKLQTALLSLFFSTMSFAAVTTDIYEGYVPHFNYDGTPSSNPNTCSVFLTNKGNNNFRVFEASRSYNSTSHREFFFNPVDQTTEVEGYIPAEQRSGMVQGEFSINEAGMTFDFGNYSIDISTENDSLTAMYYSEPGSNITKKAVCAGLRFIKTVDGEGHFGSNYYKPPRN